MCFFYYIKVVLHIYLPSRLSFVTITKSLTRADLTEGTARVICTHLTNAAHSCHPAVAVSRALLLALLGEEEVDFIVVADAAAQALPHQSRTHEVCLCKAEEMNRVTR